MLVERNLLVVVDPLLEGHTALQRAVVHAEATGEPEKVNLTILLAVDIKSPHWRANGASGTRDSAWLEELTAPLKTAGIKYNLVFSWSGEWTETVLATARDAGAGIVMITLHNEGAKNVISDEVWYLLRNAPVPVLLDQGRQAGARKSILAAVKVQDEQYDQLNKKVLDLGKALTDIYDAKLHVVNAYSDSLHYPDPMQLLNWTGVPKEQLHVKPGAPDDVIRTVAEQVDADLVLVGTARRTGLRAALRGNTIEKIVDRLGQDIVMVL